MASGVDKKLTKHLECAICLERFKQPKVLSCQHIYCKTCLERLVTTNDRGNYEVTCPECRRKTEIPGADVNNLPTNFLINNLLSELDGQCVDTFMCENHRQEELKLLCQTCDELICRDCALVEHRDHKYKFARDIYPAVREKLETFLDELRAKMFALETLLKTIRSQKDSAEITFNAHLLKVDVLINRQIEALEKKRESLKDQFRKIAQVQKDRHENQEKSLSSSLSSMKTTVEVAEQVLRRGNEIELLAAKEDINQQLTSVNSATAIPQLRGMISCKLEVDSNIDRTILENLSKISIREEDDDAEYTILMRKFGLRSVFIPSSSLKTAPFTSTVNVCENFEIHRKKDNAGQAEALNNVQVNIKRAGSKHLIASPATKITKDGHFSFQYLPGRAGNLEIEVLVDGRHVKGSPFKWRVSEVSSFF